MPKLLFISYAHEDKKWCDEFKRMLYPAQGTVKVWSDGLIAVGSKWAEQINVALDKADVGLLLVTTNFLASEFINNVELQRMLDAARTRDVLIYWVPVSASLVRFTELQGLQSAGSDRLSGKTLDEISVSERGKAIQEICIDIVSRLSAPPIGKDSREKLTEQVQSRLGGRYSISNELISSGKFSLMYRGHSNLGQAVGIRLFVADELDSWAQDEFGRCVSRAAGLRSATFVRNFEYGKDTSPHYLVSEFVAGERMSDFLRRYPRGVPLAMAKSILIDLAEGIQEMHRHHWRRGEMCPSDVLIEASGSARMSSVNFSNVVREQNLLTGNFLVDRESMSYMTPERFYGHPLTEATDQYSLALLATELLGGEPIERVMHPCDLAQKEQLFTKLESGRSKWASRSPAFAGILFRMLRTDPGDRWPSMSDVVDRLRNITIEKSTEDVAREIATSSFVEICSAHGVKGEHEFYEKFYRKFFSSSADIKSRFQGIDMRRQHKVLNHAIYGLLRFRPSASREENRELYELAQRHARNGIEPRHYELFLEAFMETVHDYEADVERLQAWRCTLENGIKFIVKGS